MPKSFVHRDSGALAASIRRQGARPGDVLDFRGLKEHESDALYRSVGKAGATAQLKLVSMTSRGGRYAYSLRAVRANPGKVVEHKERRTGAAIRHYDRGELVREMDRAGVWRGKPFDPEMGDRNLAAGALTDRFPSHEGPVKVTKISADPYGLMGTDYTYRVRPVSTGGPKLMPRKKRSNPARRAAAPVRVVVTTDEGYRYTTTVSALRKQAQRDGDFGAEEIADAVSAGRTSGTIGGGAGGSATFRVVGTKKNGTRCTDISAFR